MKSDKSGIAHLSVHDLQAYIYACDVHPCYSWLMRQTLQKKQGIANSLQVGKNLPIMGKTRHRNRFKCVRRNLRNLETLRIVLGMNIA